MRLLIVEDEERIAELVRSALVKAGFTVDVLNSALDADAAVRSVSYDAIILDLGLPDGEGLSVLDGMRGRSDMTPVLVLTARDGVEDRVLGLNTGADDYLVKPFAATELVARTKALLRRPGHALGVVLEAGNVVFDTVGREAWVNGAAVSLARRELAVLEHLLRRLGRVVPKSVLEEKLYGNDEEPESNTIPVHISNLRKRLMEAGADVEIHTVRGVGYLLTEIRG
jgi:DNA-binding response OmpR family regulator